MSTADDILCFANDWRTDPTSKHHLLREFSTRHQVLWVEAAGMRRPKLSSGRDLGRILTKARSFLRPARQALPNLRAYSPPSIPLPGSSVAEWLNRRLYRATLGRELRRAGMSAEPMMWVYAPHVAPLIRNLPRSFLLYHCVDRWSAFQEYDASLMEAYESEIARKADLVIASAADLAEHCRLYSDNVHYVPHGVDHQHFATALEDGPLPEEIAEIPEPRVGFFGLLHEWVDLDLIGSLADSLPYQFVLIGSSDQDLSALRRRANVHLLGRKPYSTLPDYCRGFSAAIVPFRLSELTRSVNPIKLREYAAAGLPIVSTALPEVQKCSDFVLLAESFAEWRDRLQEAVGMGSDGAWRARQSAGVVRFDWTHVAQGIAELIERAR